MFLKRKKLRKLKTLQKFHENLLIVVIRKADSGKQLAVKPRDPVQAGTKYMSATIEINGNPCGCSNKMVNYCNLFNNYTNAFFLY